MVLEDEADALVAERRLLTLPDGPMMATAAPRASDSDTPLRMGRSPRGVR